MNDVDRPDCTDQPLAPDQQQAGAVVPAEPGGRWRCSLEELPWAPRRTDRVAVVGAGMVGLAIAWFLTGFAHNCTTRRWRRGMAAHRGVNRQALDAFDELTAGGVEAPAQPADPFLVCFSRPDERARLLEELGELERTGQKVGFDVLTGEQARERAPILTEQVAAAVQLHDQRFIDPPRYLAALAGAVRARRAVIGENTRVLDVFDDGQQVWVRCRTGMHRYDAVVIATGAWLPELTSRFGVRVPVQAGRGYSFTVAAEQLPEGPVYLPVKRIACTLLLGERPWIAGMMEFRDPDEPLGQRRVRAIVDAVRPFLRGGWTSASAGTNGSTPARAPRRVAPGRSDDLAAGVRRRRARHVGHRARPAHRPTARRRHRQRERALRAATLPPAPVTRPPGGAGRRRSDRCGPAGSALLLHVAGCRSRPRRSATRSCDPIHDESR